ncbi:hypothetical protein [Streptomyces sp. GS7]|uniref:hypothetical protein n=1 Tax=Streptomyces sp. GS7 TaxID=2692234 RepID=UPI001316A22F|nr:hypothetical protein [Streptomyces sp. GS7]QHC24840.1 hypothetical protein GR130_29170 [Streptomyces sp. GS7]
MATAPPPLSAVRHRDRAVPLRALWAAVLLLAVLLAHGARAESAEGHLDSAVPAAARTTAAAQRAIEALDGAPARRAAHTVQPAHSAPADPAHHADHPAPAGHPAHPVCLAGQVQQGAELAPPRAVSFAGSPCRAPVPARYGTPADAFALPPPSGTTGSVVQQV